MGEEKPNYYAILPANVRYDERLKPYEMILYAEITALSNKTGICWASNNYFAKLYHVTPQAVSKWILNLKNCGYISIEYQYKENSKEILRRNIKLEVSTHVDRGINNGLQGYQRTIKDNNTSNNNTSNNIYQPKSYTLEVNKIQVLNLENLYEN